MSGAARLGWWALCGLVLIPPFLISPTADDAFRLPKLAASETLGLVSLLALCAGWWRRGGLSLGELVRRPGVRFAGLLLLAALPGILVTATHPPLTRRAGVSLAIALACLAVWSVRLDRATLRRALDLLAIPAVALAALAILQAHDVFTPFAFAAGEGRQRYGLTSLAGNVGDFAGYLVLPVVVLQAGLLGGGTRARRVTRILLLAVVIYAVCLSQTLAALAAAGVASLLFWTLTLPARRRWLAATPIAILVVAALLVPGLERRVDRKVRELRDLELNALLSGRLDGWRVSIAMVRARPLFGVGHGGYRAHFAETKLELVERGEHFYSSGRSEHFANAHNDYLEALSEWGLWGAAAAMVALWLLARRVRRLWETLPRTERALACAGCAAIAMLALASFPFHVALTAYPWVIFAAWLFAGESAVFAAAPGERQARPKRADRADLANRGVVPARAVAALATAVLAPALVLHARSLLGRLEASRILRTTTQVAQLAMQTNAMAARSVIQANLRPLHRAEHLDPVDAAVPIAIGSHYLLLDNAASARDAYLRALALEPRATLYLNLARVLLLEGRRAEAVAAAGRAAMLDPALRGDAEALGWNG